MNAIGVINTYRYKNMWVFDDEIKGLDKEPFVAGADTLLDRLAKGAKELTLVFSGNSFPDAQLKVDKMKEYGPQGGTDYYLKELDHKLWLCPALLKYFDNPPESIYFQVKV